MEMRIKHVKKWGLAMAGSFFWLAASASAQSTPAQGGRATENGYGDRATQQELSRFDEFLDSHREIAEQLQKDPSLANSPKFLKSHPALQSFLQDHQGVSNQLRNDPNQFMREEGRYDRREDNGQGRRQQLARFDQFLDTHKEVASQLRSDPWLINNPQFLADHPELREYLQNHAETKEAIQRDPNAFMQQEQRYDRREDQNMSRDNDRDRDIDRDRDRDRDRDVNRDRGQRQEQMVSFEGFLDSHREVGEQLRKNPSLANDPSFVKNHPALQTYLQQHPVVKDDLARNPDAFRQAEGRYEHREPSDLTPEPDRDASRYDGRDEQKHYNKDTASDQSRKDYDRDRSRDRDAIEDRSAMFGSFLGTHASIAHQLANNPSLANDKDYLASHAELQSYLSSHPEVRLELTQNPQGFVKAAQQYNNGTTNNPATSAPATATPPPQPKH